MKTMSREIISWKSKNSKAVITKAQLKFVNSFVQGLLRREATMDTQALGTEILGFDHQLKSSQYLVSLVRKPQEFGVSSNLILARSFWWACQVYLVGMSLKSSQPPEAWIKESALIQKKEFLDLELYSKGFLTVTLGTWSSLKLDPGTQNLGLSSGTKSFETSYLVNAPLSLLNCHICAL